MIAIPLLIISCFTAGIAADNSCGDWEPYKDEKCFRIFETAGLLDYSNAENFCKEQDDSRLLSIDLQEKQKFIETYLKSNSILDNVWIGLKYENDSYVWADGSLSLYTNWASGSPKNDSQYCVQLQTESANFGLWSDELCGKKNLVLCEKIQLWSLARMQTTIINLMKEVVSIGFIYVQLPKEKPPYEIWPSMEWEDISADYAGVFFRTEGGNAAPFGEVQEADSPRLTFIGIVNTTSGAQYEVDVNANNEFSTPLDIDGNRDHTGKNIHVKVSNGEVRPRNMAIKIWRRVQ